MDIEILKQFLVVSVAVWVFTSAIGAIPAVSRVLDKKVLALLFGIVAILAGYFTGFFVGNIVSVLAVGIISISVAELVYDKIIKAIADVINNKLEKK